MRLFVLLAALVLPAGAVGQQIDSLSQNIPVRVIVQGDTTIILSEVNIYTDDLAEALLTLEERRAFTDRAEESLAQVTEDRGLLGEVDAFFGSNAVRAALFIGGILVLRNAILKSRDNHEIDVYVDPPDVDVDVDVPEAPERPPEAEETWPPGHRDPPGRKKGGGGEE